ncbi:CBO0543 family protein [Bacillus taeanensis]|uniref:Uncharacterized protein n=1 Tax=Bacillus taeanensis TaxID=273032 RepID=A0A366XRD1_9BACI|nr:CBO0543 family protein [Bacillus taeanensis]RBW68088.1 hypothetical protein DS031_18605 [Bacillus taeanensis]
MNNQHPSWNEIINIRETLRDTYWEYWINHDLFSFNWWVLLVLNILFIYVAYKVLDRTRLFELLTVGGLVIAFSTMLDVILIQYVLTAYPTSLTPLSPSFFTSSTYIILPVSYMLLYQFFSTWKSFIVAMVIAGIFLAFVTENVFRLLNIYQYIQWNSFLSLTIYMGIAIILKWIMNNLLKYQK